MWHFEKNSASQILREINFADSRNTEFAIFTHEESLNFNFHYFFHV